MSVYFHLKFIGSCIHAIKLKYQSIQKINAHSFPLRIIHQKYSIKNKDTVLTLQIVGKNLVFKLYATELFNDKKLLKALSPADLVKFITIPTKQTGYKRNNTLIFPYQAEYKLVAKKYDHISQQTLFTIEIIHANATSYKKRLSAFEIVKNPLILQKLSSQEIYDLGFTMGSETILKEMHYLANNFTHNSV